MNIRKSNMDSEDCHQSLPIRQPPTHTPPGKTTLDAQNYTTIADAAKMIDDGAQLRQPDAKEILQTPMKLKPGLDGDDIDERGKDEHMRNSVQTQDFRGAASTANGDDPQSPQVDVAAVNHSSPVSSSGPDSIELVLKENKDMPDSQVEQQHKALLLGDLSKSLIKSNTAEMRAAEMKAAEMKAAEMKAAEMKEELARYKSLEMSALRLCLDLHSVLGENTADKAINAKREQLKRSVENIQSTVNDPKARRQPSISHQVAEYVNILYRVRLIESGKEDKWWYQDIPFTGIDLERNDPAETEAISIFDVIIDVEGKIETENVPPDESRKTWKGRKNIEFGKDISMTRQLLPAISIKAPQLLVALKHLLPTTRARATLASFTIPTKCYSNTISY